MDGIRDFEVYRFFEGVEGDRSPFVGLNKPHWGLDIHDDGRIYLNYAFQSGRGREYTDLEAAVKEFNSKYPKTKFTVADIEGYAKEVKGE